MPTPEELQQLDYAMRYYEDAPPECWVDEEILKITFAGGWGRCHGDPNGGLMGRQFGNYVFRYRGLPLWDLLDFH